MSITKQPPHPGLRAAAGAWDPVEFHEVLGARLALSRRGRGPRVVCLHATGHGARDYEDLSLRLADSFEVVAVDWPGQGSSPRDSEPASASRYASLLLALLDVLGGETAIVIGCSIGGAAALQAAVARPESIRALVLCNAGGLAALDPVSRLAVRGMHRFFAAGARGARWFPAAFELYYRMVLPSPSARPQRERIVAAVSETAEVLAEAWASFAEPEADLREAAARVSCPVLFAWASGDRILPWARSAKAAMSVPDHRVRHFHGGHAAFLEDPAAFEDEFRLFAGAAAAPEALRRAG